MEIVVKPVRVKRRHSEAFRQAVVAACCEPGVSVAGVALANGLNANLVRNWLRMRGITPPSRRLPKTSEPGEIRPTPDFIPVQIEPTPTPPGGIRLELRRGGSTVHIEWPLAAAGECGAWLREWLR